MLDLNWLEDGAVTFKADNGKFVGTKKSGHLFANVDTVDERSKHGNHDKKLNNPKICLCAGITST